MLRKILAVTLPVLAAAALSAVALPAEAKDNPITSAKPQAAETIPVAPYIDITRETPKLTDVAEASGQKNFTLAFALSSADGCEPTWGGTIDLNEPRIIDQVKALKDSGGDVIVASGGAAGPYLENSCKTADDLYKAYAKILDATGSNHLDVDVEAPIPQAVVNEALKKLQDERDTTISYTLRVQGSDFGVDTYSLEVLQDAAKQGVEVTVNPMLMNFGYDGEWGSAMVSAAEATLKQMADVWPDYSKEELAAHLGITPMIGNNDSGMVTTQDDAKTVLKWAQDNHIGFIGFWSIGRDNGDCADGGVKPDCSGIAQESYEFTKIFSEFTG